VSVGIRQTTARAGRSACHTVSSEIAPLRACLSRCVMYVRLSSGKLLMLTFMFCLSSDVLSYVYVLLLHVYIAKTAAVRQNCWGGGRTLSCIAFCCLPFQVALLTAAALLQLKPIGLPKYCSRWYMMLQGAQWFQHSSVGARDLDAFTAVCKGCELAGKLGRARLSPPPFAV
jgi:hypothetical protein